MIHLSNAEADRLARRILPELEHFAQLYDEEKYPPQTYLALRNVFQQPDTVTRGDIREALRWKFGHMNKPKIPDSHEQLICEIQEKWPKVAGELSISAPKAFGVMDEQFGGPYRFITIAFLTHLLHPTEAPIIDQHNFRAVNILIGEVRAHPAPRRKPSRYEDISFIASFMNAVRDAWTRGADTGPLSDLKLDRYLMMFGKALKVRRLH